MITMYDLLLSELQPALESAWDSYMDASISGLPFSMIERNYICWKHIRQAIILVEKLKKGEKDV